MKSCLRRHSKAPPTRSPVRVAVEGKTMHRMIRITPLLQPILGSRGANTICDRRIMCFANKKRVDMSDMAGSRGLKLMGVEWKTAIPSIFLCTVCLIAQAS
jgi:hypothetical protein